MKKTILTTGILFIILNCINAQSWYDLSPIMIDARAVYAVSPDTVFVAGSDLIKSYNGGISWNYAKGYKNSYYRDIHFLDKDTGYVVGDYGIILKTTDCGVSWNVMLSDSSMNLTSIYSASPGNIWAVSDSGDILNSKDYGNSWQINNTITTERLNDVGFVNSLTGFIIGNNSTLLKTIDGGLSWNSISIGTILDLASLSITDTKLYLISGNVDASGVSCFDFWRSDDLNTFTLISTSPTMSGSANKIYFTNDSTGYCMEGNCIVKNCGIDIYKSTDAGITWQLSYTDFGSSIIINSFISDIHFANDTDGYAIQSEQLFKYENSVSVDEIKHNDNFLLYPNPAFERLNYSFNNKIEGGTISIVSLNGRNVLSEKIEKNNGSINLEGVSEGIYIVKIQTLDEIMIMKLIKN